MKINYCTLFDSNYLTRGLAMYESLKKHSDSFHLYIFAFDDRSYQLLKKLDLDSTTIISLQEFEDEALLKIKSDRGAGEYCWTCTPSTIKYTIQTYALDACTYLDADLYFFSDPSILIDELNKKSVLITEHRYTPKYDQSATSGIYCVQFMTFKNDKNGMKVLNWWREACNEWCYARFEDGKFGDQKYLDDWITRFEGVHELQNLGGGVAPWNVQQYDFTSTEDRVEGVERSSENIFQLVFYHFHNFKFLENSYTDLGHYIYTNNDLMTLYTPYVQHLEKITTFLLTVDDKHDYNGIRKKETFHWKTPLQVIKHKLLKRYNVYKKTHFSRN